MQVRKKAKFLSAVALNSTCTKYAIHKSVQEQNMLKTMKILSARADWSAKYVKRNILGDI